LIAVDSSVVVKLLVVDPDSLSALGLLSDSWERSEPIVAPPLLSPEVANALYQRVRSSQMTYQEAEKAMERFHAMSIASVPTASREVRSLSQRAQAIANDYNLPATYDAHYIALAEGLDCDLWTADRRLLNALGGRLPFVRDLATFAA
jgi:predicted nucleic acid-binding protein